MLLKVIVRKLVYRLKEAWSLVRNFLHLSGRSIKESSVKKAPILLEIKGIAVFAVLLVVFILAGYARSFGALLPFFTSSVADYGGIYKESIVGEFSQFNPIFSSKNLPDADAVALMFSGLTKLDVKGGVVPDLAESWKLSGTKIYTFKLRKGVEWHDGKAFTADDVVFTFNKINEPDVKSPLMVNWDKVQVEKIDDHTVKFTLPNPYSPFLTLSAQPILPKHIYEQVQDRQLSITEENQNPVGTGPFQFAGVQKLPGGIAVLSVNRFEAYYGPEPFLDGIELKTYSNNTDALDAVAKKQVMGTGEINSSLFETAQKFKELNKYAHRRGAVYAAFINTRSAILGNVNMREALILAINKEAILKDAFNGQGQLTNRMIPKGYLGYSHEEYTSTYSLKKAGDSLAKLGWKKIEQGTLTSGDKVLVLKLIALDTDENRKATSVLGGDLRSLGIELETHFGDLADLEANFLQNRSFDLFLTSFSLGHETDPYTFWHSTQVNAPGLNFSAFNNQDADRLIEGARRVADDAGRSLKLKEFENILIGATPAIFILSPYYIHGANSELKISDENLVTIVEPKDRFIGIEKWYINEKRVERDILSKIK